jgi:hypothetical protein
MKKLKSIPFTKECKEKPPHPTGKPPNEGNKKTIHRGEWFNI